MTKASNRKKSRVLRLAGAICVALVVLALAATKIRAEPKIQIVSMAALLVDHGRFEGVKIMTVGSIIVADDVKGLCLSEIDAKKGIAPNCIWLDFDPTVPLPSGQTVMESWNGEYVSVDGVVGSGSFGHYGAVRFAIREISDIRLWRVKPRF